MKTYLIEISRDDGAGLSGGRYQAEIVEDAIIQAMADFWFVRGGVGFSGLVITSEEVFHKEAQA